MSPADWLTLIADRAPALRAAGVTELELDGARVLLAPHVPPPDKTAPTRQLPEESSDPLGDAATYAGGIVPGYRIQREWDEEDDPS